MSLNHSLGVVNEGINSIREMTDAEYLSYKDAAGVLWRYAEDEQAFVIMWSNYVELTKTLDAFLRDYSENYSTPTPVMTIQINRQLVNLLCSMRTFLDHSQYNLKNRYGPASLEFENFKTTCSRLYDRDFSYRFIYRLRNYTQHCQLPLGHAEIGSRLDPATGKPVSYLKIHFVKERLLKDFDWSDLKSELEAMPSLIEINPHIEKMMTDLNQVHETLIRDQLRELIDMADRIEKILDPTKKMTGTPCILTYEGKLIRGPGEKLHVRIEWIPLHVLELIKELRAIDKKSTN